MAEKSTVKRVLVAIFFELVPALAYNDIHIPYILVGPSPVWLPAVVSTGNTNDTAIQ